MKVEIVQEFVEKKKEKEKEETNRMRDQSNAITQAVDKEKQFLQNAVETLMNQLSKQ